MYCPKCTKEIQDVYVTSYCTQTATLDSNRTLDYSNLDIGDTIEIRCPECDEDIKDAIVEG